MSIVRLLQSSLKWQYMAVAGAGAENKYFRLRNTAFVKLRTGRANHSSYLFVNKTSPGKVGSEIVHTFFTAFCKMVDNSTGTELGARAGAGSDSRTYRTCQLQ